MAAGVDARKAGKVLSTLLKQYPDAKLVLRYSNPLELLIATILAAQCKDERVNEVTADLFPRYKRAADWAALSQAELQDQISSLSLFRNKAKSIIGCCKQIVEGFGGQLPANVEDMTSLPGVGRKTANIVLGNAFGQQAVAVDTHVKRVAQRLGFSEQSNPDKIERDLCELLPRDRWTRATLVLGAHGRAVCLARKPKCAECPVSRDCPSAQT